MIHKFDNIILALLLASILALVISVFSVSFFFLKELLLLAILVLFSIAIFHGMTMKKKWVYSYSMLIFAIGIFNGFFIYFMTYARLSYLLVITNLVGFIIVLKVIPTKKPRPIAQAEPKVIIKEVKEEPEEKKVKAKKVKKAEEEAKKIKPMSEQELLKTEKQIVDELDKAIEEKEGEMAEKEQELQFIPAQKGQFDEYYDSLDGVDLDNSYYDEKSVHSKKAETKEVDDMMDEIKEFEKEVKKEAKTAKTKKKSAGKIRKKTGKKANKPAKRGKSGRKR